jgi:hypothetical protein
MSLLKPKYYVGDLVELARYGQSPKTSEDRVYGTIIEAIDPTDYFVPRYVVKVQYLRSAETFAAQMPIMAHEGDTITVMEYDIAGTTEEGTQD